MRHRGGETRRSILLFSPSTNTRDSLSFGRSMGIRFACHECGKRLNIKNEFAGRRGVCPACSAKMRIPLSDAETSTPSKSFCPSREPMPRERCIGTLQRPTAADPTAPSSLYASTKRKQLGTFVRPAVDNTGPRRRTYCESGSKKGVSRHLAPVARRLAAVANCLRVATPIGGRLPGQPVAGTFRPHRPRPCPAGDRSFATSAGHRDGVASTTISAVDWQCLLGNYSAHWATVHWRRNAPVPVVTSEVAFAGQSKIGSQRRARSSRRVMWIGVLSAVAIMLVGVLVVVAKLG